MRAVQSALRSRALYRSVLQVNACLFVVSLALMLAWQRLSIDDKLVFAVAAITFALMGSAVSIVLDGLA